MSWREIQRILTLIEKISNRIWMSRNVGFSLAKAPAGFCVGWWVLCHRDGVDAQHGHSRDEHVSRTWWLHGAAWCSLWAPSPAHWVWNWQALSVSVTRIGTRVLRDQEEYQDHIFLVIIVYYFRSNYTKYNDPQLLHTPKFNWISTCYLQISIKSWFKIEDMLTSEVLLSLSGVAEGLADQV